MNTRAYKGKSKAIGDRLCCYGMTSNNSNGAHTPLFLKVEGKKMALTYFIHAQRPTGLSADFC